MERTLELFDLNRASPSPVLDLSVSVTGELEGLIDTITSMLRPLGTAVKDSIFMDGSQTEFFA
jgi:hypothetical protein